MTDDQINLRILLAVARELCQCTDPDKTPPTDWETKQRIPHHCDCPLYAIELPPKTAKAAHPDAKRRRAELLRR